MILICVGCSGLMCVLFTIDLGQPVFLAIYRLSMMCVLITIILKICGYIIRVIRDLSLQTMFVLHLRLMVVFNAKHTKQLQLNAFNGS